MLSNVGEKSVLPHYQIYLNIDERERERDKIFQVYIVQINLYQRREYFKCNRKKFIGKPNGFQ